MSSGQSNLQGILQERVDSLFKDGKIDEARRVAQTSLESARRASNTDPEGRLNLVTALETLGNLSQHLGDSASAEALYCEAIEYLQQEYGDSAQVARIESSLAGLYDFGHREEEAIPLYEHAIELFEATSPPMLLQAANLRNNLAMIYKGAGHNEKAEEHYLAAVRTFEKAYGHENEEVAAVYNNLGALYYQFGYQEQAREMHLSALEIRRKLFGDDHADVAQSHSNLALVYHELGDGRSCQRSFEDSLAILARHIAEDLEDYTVVAENYADLLRLSGQEKKAASIEKKMQKVLRKQTKKAGIFSRR
jgi:tetratricopeptide (TPR) repeat protein